MFACYGVLLVLMVATPYRGLLLLIIAAMNFAAGLAQPAEVWANKSTGVVQVAMLGWGGLGGSLLCLYCFHFGYYAPAFTFGVYAAGQLLMVAQWYFVRRSAGSAS